MKRLFSMLVIAILAITVVAVPLAFAADYYRASAGGGSAPNLYRLNILSSRPSASTGTAPNTYKFGQPMSKITCAAISSGVTASSIIYAVEASYDGTNWAQILYTGATTSTLWPNILSLPSGSVVFDQIRANMVTVGTSSAGNATGTVGSVINIPCDVLQ